MHYSGFVNIIGRPNVGKSTLINALIGEKLSIVTPKVQTTRHRVLGILNEENCQIIFSDTPGIIENPRYMLQERMMGFVKEALEDADVVLYLVDINENPGDEHTILKNILLQSKTVLVLINKIDKLTQEEVVDLINKWKEATGLPEERIIPVSALKAFNMLKILDMAKALLPENPPYYDKDLWTDRSERFLASEVIREKIFKKFYQEIPYSVEVVIESFKDEPTIIRIAAEIYVNRASQKPILIGRGGEALKAIGTQARKELEESYGKKVFLELFVKVKEDWRENTNMLRQFGYE
jgi:GTP-binding protein Era